MKISLNHMRYYQQQYNWSSDLAPDGVEALVERIGAQLGAVEEIVHYGDRFKDVLLVKVVSCEDHPNADRLHVCKIDDGGKAQNVERDDQGHVQVVCGAPNVREGLTVAWLPPGATVPESLDKDPFVLEARPLRGVVSNGMLASPRELTIGDSHDGILEVGEEDGEIAPGTSFAEQFGLVDDVIIDMENKMFTHRPDCFGMLGVAREIAGIQQQAFTSPEWWKTDVRVTEREADELTLEVQNELPELVPRFTAMTMRNVVIKPSPVWLQVSLARLGIRPINNIVDLTNYNMLLTGQPLHAYDYDKVMAQDEGATHATIVVRHPHEGEKITLLNGKEIEPRAEAIMIATRDKLIGVGGVMGGQDTEVDDATKNIIIEVANFDMYSIRRTSMAHGLFTDAVTRFNKGQSPLQTKAVLAKIVDDIRRLAGGKVASELIDDVHLPGETLARGAVHPPVTVTREFINARLGFDLSADDMAQLLTNVEFKVETGDDTLTITAPFWRTDIEIPEDIVEEVGRLYGFDHLPLDLPARTLAPASKNYLFELKRQVRSVLRSAGANEMLTYTFVHGNLLQKAGQDVARAFQLSNALSPDLQYYRVSLAPSLLDKVHSNIRAGYDQFALFELGKVHILGENDSDGLPRECHALSMVFAANDKAAEAYEGAPYYQARKYLMHMLSHFRVQSFVQFEPLQGADLYNNHWIEQMTAPFEPNRSAVLRDEQGLIWGVVGEYKASVRKALKLPAFTAGFELDPLLFAQESVGAGYVQLPRFPKVEQDICLKVPADTTYKQLFDFVWQKLGEVQPPNTFPALGPVDIYQREDDAAHKQITLRFSLASFERTLTDDEVTRLLDHVASAAQAELGAERL